MATVLPNCPEAIEIYLACLQAGWYLVPINHHLVASEIAYILRDSGARVFVGHERFSDACVDAADEAEIPGTACLAVGEILGFNSYDRLRDAQPTTDPAERTIGDVMNYTSGTTGNPKGVYRPLSGATPEQAALGLSGILLLFGINPQDDNVHIVGSPLYHTAVLRFGGGSVHFGHTVVLMDKWLPEEMLALIERHRVTTSHMVPTQFHRLLALPDDVRNRYDLSSLRHMIHAAAPCPVDVKRRMIEWWGPVIDEYYAASEGGGTVVSTAEWLEKPGTVGRPWPISEIAIFDDAGNRVDRARGDRHRLHGHAGRGLRVPRRQGEDGGQPDRQVLHRRRRGLPRRGRLPLPPRPQDRHDHLGRAPTSTRPRSRACCSCTPRSSTSPSSACPTRTGARR